MTKGTKIVSIILGLLGLLITAYIGLISADSANSVATGNLPLIANIVFNIWTVMTFVFSVTLFFNRLRMLGWIVGAADLICMILIILWAGPFTDLAIGYTLFIVIGIVNKIYGRRRLVK